MTTATIRRPNPGGLDAYGDPATSTETSTIVHGCALAPAGSTEATERGRQGTVTTAVLYVPTGTDVAAGDTVTVDGATWTVEGVPDVWEHPRTGRGGVAVNLKRAVG